MKTGSITLLVLCILALNAVANYLPIGTIQGSGHTSSYVGSNVTTDGIVTRVYRDGFIIQSKTPDASQDTSDAIYVYQKDNQVQTGNELRVTGKIEEYVPGGNDSHNLSLTQIRADEIKLLSRRSDPPRPVVLNYLLPDFPKIIKQPGSPFNSKLNALDFFESLEHMRVVILDSVIVGPKTKYGEIAVAVPQAKPLPASSSGGVVKTDYASAPPKLLINLDRENAYTYNTGDRLKNPIHGTLTYS